MIDLITETVEFAKEKHQGQFDKVGRPYIYHPLRVNSKIAKCLYNLDIIGNNAKCTDIEVQMTAILHDTLEDTDATFEELKEKFGDKVAEAVKSVTRNKNETYEDFIKRACKNEIGGLVKAFDIMDNLNMMRFVMSDYEFDNIDFIRIKKYIKSLRYLVDNYQGKFPLKNIIEYFFI